MVALLRVGAGAQATGALATDSDGRAGLVLGQRLRDAEADAARAARYDGDAAQRRGAREEQSRSGLLGWPFLGCSGGLSALQFLARALRPGFAALLVP